MSDETVLTFQGNAALKRRGVFVGTWRWEALITGSLLDGCRILADQARI
ncbi:MAG: hypothetical protein JOZ51_04335 [Chloroflexi bacterium]|nr:hypothetical protein [Chloroflexota bacterium]